MNPLDYLRPEIRALRPYTIEHTSARVKLDANESPFEPPQEVLEEITSALGRIPMNRYPDPAAQILKERIAETCGVDPERLMVGNGSDELIGYLITAFTGGEGVLYPVPTFSMYGIIARCLGQRPIEIPLNQDFEIDGETLQKAVTEHSPQIVFLASPNNPTGNRIPKGAVLPLLENPRCLVVIDEAYIDFSGKEGFLDAVGTFPNLLILRTLSKIGMAALRLGFLVAPRELIQELEKVRLPYNTNTLSQVAASVLLGHPELLAEQIGRVRSERKELARQLSEIAGLQVFPSEANFILFRTERADDLYHSLLKEGILIRNLNQPGPLRACLRVTVGRPEENAEFLEHLKQFARSRS